VVVVRWREEGSNVRRVLWCDLITNHLHASIFDIKSTMSLCHYLLESSVHPHTPLQPVPPQANKNMKFLSTVTVVATLASANAFVQPLSSHAPVSRGNRNTVRMAVDPATFVTATTNLVAGVLNDDVFVDKVGSYPWGEVQAPGKS